MIAEEQERGVSWRLLLTSCLIFFALSVQAADDPFAGLAAPVITGSSSVLYGDGTTGNISLSSGGTATKPAAKFVSSDTTLYPGIYWGGIKITGGNVTMLPGRYVMAGGGFSISGSSPTVSGSGVFIYNTRDPFHPTTEGAYANINLLLDGTILTSPTASGDGYYSGLLFFNDRNPSNTSVIKLTGMSSPTQGTLYSANGLVQVSSGPQVSDAGISVVAKEFTVPPTVTVTIGSLNALTSLNLPAASTLVLSNGFTEVHDANFNVSAGGWMVTISNSVAGGIPVAGNNISYFGSVDIGSAYGNTSIFTNASSLYTNIIVGKDTGWTGTFFVANGLQQVSSSLIIGSNVGAVGNVIVTGGQLSNHSTTIGNSGSGAMVVSNGFVSLGSTILGKSAAASGSLTVAGGSVVMSDLNFMDIASGTGSVLVTGGELQVTGEAWIGGVGGGSLIVSNGSTHFDDLRIVGNAGATRMILAGGTVVADSGMLVDNPVLISGGDLQVNWPTYLGWRGWGMLTISNGTAAFTDVYVGLEKLASLDVAGGTIKANNIVVGATASSSGTLLTVSGGNLHITNTAANGTLEVRNGSLALNGGLVVVDRLQAANGTSSVVNFNSGLLRSGGTTVSNGMAFLVGDGVQSATFDLIGGTHSFADGLLLASNAMLVGNGTIIGSVTNFGGIAPGHSPGLLAITGDLELMDSSVLTMEVGGPDANQYDRIDVTGLLVAGGWLNVNFTNGYAPAKGEMFDLFGFGAATNSFAGITLPTFQYAGTDWDTSHLLAPASDPLSGSLIFIPEPSSIGLLLASAGVICRRQRRPGTARKQPPC